MHSSYRIPVIGYVLNLMMNLIRMPSILRHFRKFEAFTNARFSEQVDKSLGLSLQVNQISMEVNGIRSVVDTLSNDTQKRFDNLQEGKAEKQALNLLKHSILELQKSLRTVFENMREKLSGTLSEGELRRLQSEEHHLLDALYVAFEDRFRGNREDIKERVRVYLPYIEKSHEHAQDARVLDIGCGRGEWLELLRENGYSAKGIDMNRIMVEQCRDRGLDVVEYEALLFLREQASGIFSVVTGLHIIEHLPLPVLIQLLDEVLRVLRPGGLAIFETPNPENMIVGATFFHIDPTHGNPVHPLTMDFLLDQRGFSRTEILRLHAMPSQELDSKVLNDLLFGPQDFAAIGYKQ
jgi:O-antigen chain-terminating methyltransferase